MEQMALLPVEKAVEPRVLAPGPSPGSLQGYGRRRLCGETLAFVAWGSMEGLEAGSYRVVVVVEGLLLALVVWWVDQVGRWGTA